MTSSQFISVQSLVGVIPVTKVDMVDLSRGFNCVVRFSVTLMKKSLRCSAFIKSSVIRLLLLLSLLLLQSITGPKLLTLFFLSTWFVSFQNSLGLVDLLN